MKEVLNRLQCCEEKIQEKNEDVRALKNNSKLQKEIETLKELNDFRQEKFQREIYNLKQSELTRCVKFETSSRVLGTF